MHNTTPSMVATIVKYDAPLRRYAQLLVKDQDVAASIVKEVFEWVYHLNGFNVNDKTLRSLLKGCTFKLASTWLLYGPSVTNHQNQPQ